MFAKFSFITISSQTDSQLDFTIAGYKNMFRLKMVESNSMSVSGDSRPYVSFNSYILRGNIEVPFSIKNVTYSMIEFTSYDLDNIYMSINNNNISFMGKYNVTDTTADNSDIDNCIVSMGTFVSGSGTFAYMFSSCKSGIVGYTKPRHNDVNITGFPVVIIVGEALDETWCSFNMDSWKYNETNYRICYSTLLTQNLNKPYEHAVPHYGGIIGNKTNSSGYGTNTLNGISLILPSLFYIKSTPHSANTWSYLGKSDELNYVSMYNMSSYHIIQKDYPVSGDKYVCITQYKRRKYMFDGLAIRLTDRLDITEDDTSVVPSIQ